MRKTFDVFLSHNSDDKPLVESIAWNLRKKGIKPWLDKWQLLPGRPWIIDLEKGLDSSRTCAVFLGKNGIGPWETQEIQTALIARTRDPDFFVIPVLLPGAKKPHADSLPFFLRPLTWVNFKKGVDDEQALQTLIAGIRGTRVSPTHPRTVKRKEFAVVRPYMKVASNYPSRTKPSHSSQPALQRKLDKSARELEKNIDKLGGSKLTLVSVRSLQYLLIQIGDVILGVRRQILDNPSPDNQRVYEIAEHWGKADELIRSFSHCLDQVALGKIPMEQLVSKSSQVVSSLNELASSLDSVCS